MLKPIVVWLCLLCASPPTTVIAQQTSPSDAAQSGDLAPVVELPVTGARTPLPVHILARLGRPGDQVAITLRWADGTELTRTAVLLDDRDRTGLLVTSVDWTAGEHSPRPPPTQPAALEISDLSSGAAWARVRLTIQAPDDPATRQVMLYWVAGETVIPAPRHIPRTEAVAAAALQELLWGPVASDPRGVTSALPLPTEVLRYAGRGAGWASRVTVRHLGLSDGLVTADLSPELEAYGGGGARAAVIRQQLEQTLHQFSSVRQVQITVGGERAGILEP
jgi:hypothetical protein